MQSWGYVASASRDVYVYSPVAVWWVQVRELSREDIEKDLMFVGFIIISCPLKPDSKAVVREIRDASHHVCIYYN